jgi:transcriptional regulator with XRE-family HTH domain
MAPSELVRLANTRDACRSGAARLIRLASGLTLEEVGREIGVSVSTVFRWENGERVPRGEAAARYARLLAALADREKPRRRRGVKPNWKSRPGSGPE